MDYSKWSLGCLVREVGKNLPNGYRITDEGSFCQVTAKANDIKDVVVCTYTYRAQWLLDGYLRVVRNNLPDAVHGEVYKELFRRLTEDQKERGIFHSAT